VKQFWTRASSLTSHSATQAHRAHGLTGSRTHSRGSQASEDRAESVNTGQIDGQDSRPWRGWCSPAVPCCSLLLPAAPCCMHSSVPERDANKEFGAVKAPATFYSYRAACRPPHLLIGDLSQTLPPRPPDVPIRPPLTPPCSPPPALFPCSPLLPPLKIGGINVTLGPKQMCDQRPPERDEPPMIPPNPSTAYTIPSAPRPTSAHPKRQTRQRRQGPKDAPALALWRAHQLAHPRTLGGLDPQIKHPKAVSFQPIPDTLQTVRTVLDLCVSLCHDLYSTFRHSDHLSLRGSPSVP
jgi:hypothetical protein